MKLTRRDVTIPGVVSIRRSTSCPKEEVERLGDKLNQNPVGTGPYKVAEWNTAQREYVTERFEDYQYADKLPYFDSLRWQWGIAPDLQYLKVSRDEADGSIEVPTAVANRLRGDASQAERFKQWPSFTLVWWGLDVTKPPFDDVRVRRAVNHAFNRERAAALGYSADGHFWPAGMLGYDEGAPVYEYDPEKAKALLAEAGASGFELTLPTLGATSNGSRTSQLLQQDLQAVGIKVKLKQVQETAFDLGAKVRQQYRIWNLGWGMGLPIRRSCSTA
jgi:ABC-type transport system substrate-binding protein